MLVPIPCRRRCHSPSSDPLCLDVHGSHSPQLGRTITIGVVRLDQGLAGRNAHVCSPAPRVLRLTDFHARQERIGQDLLCFQSLESSEERGVAFVAANMVAPLVVVALRGVRCKHLKIFSQVVAAPQV